MANPRRNNRDHARQHQYPGPDNEVLAANLQALLTPAIYAQQATYRQLGLRDRILNLSLMLAAVLTLLWRNVPSVQELTRMLNRENLLWAKAVEVSQQALSQRFLSFPSLLFERVFMELLPQLRQRWYQRTRRPLAASVQFASQQFEQIWVVDCSTLEALFHKLDSLQDKPTRTLAGKIATVVDLVTRLPVQIWFSENPRVSDTHFEPDLLALLRTNTLLIMDRGFYHFQFWAQLIGAQVAFICRLKAGAAYTVEQVFTDQSQVRDCLIQLGVKRKNAPQLRLRLVQVRFGSSWYSYLSSVLDPQQLPPFAVADLYRRRWRIEEAFCTVKRLLRLSYLWTGSINGVKLQIWATWLFYAVLVDLGDAVADEVGVPFEQISLEMLYRGLYHFCVAHNRGKATDPVAYFSATENQDLDVIKARKIQAPLDLSPFPKPRLTFAPSS
ncbi:MAG: IS4 family transposase [Microcoleus sp. T1-bin1]|nr:IS4 family transposase [Microcoleus sp. T1-bin1]